MIDREMYCMIERNTIKSLGLSEEYFFSLPLEMQEALLMGVIERKKENKNMVKYGLEENIKVKVLTLLKKIK